MMSIQTKSPETVRRSWSWRRICRTSLCGVCAVVLACAAATTSASAMPQASTTQHEAPVAGAPAPVRGLKVRKRDVLWGNAHRSKAPAEIVLATAIAATAEGRQIEEEGIEKGSARYDILMAKANARVRTVVRRIAIGNSRDCVVKTASYRNPDGLTVVDLTSKVVDALGGDS